MRFWGLGFGWWVFGDFCLFCGVWVRKDLFAIVVIEKGPFSFAAEIVLGRTVAGPQAEGTGR
jgi:hypothetical protein